MKLRDSQVQKRGKVLEKFEENTINPFLSQTPTNGFYEYFKMVVLGLTLFPIRIVVFILLILIAWTVSKLALTGLTMSDISNKPLSKTRKIILTPYKYLFRILLFVMGYYWIPVKGKIDPSAPVIVMNHLSFVEAFYILYACFPHMVAKKESVYVPIVGNIFRTLQPILVDRSAQNRKDTVEKINERARNQNDWSQVCIFPEGTTTAGRSLISFKAGAFNPGVPVQPVTVKLPWVHFDPHYVGGMTGLRLFFQSFTQFINYMEIEILPVYHPSADEIANPLLYANNVRKVMAKAMNVPTSNHTYEDVVMQMEAIKRNIPLDTVFGVQSAVYRTLLSSNDKFTSSEIKDLLDQFAAMDVTHVGRINFKQFCDALRLPETPEVQEIFHLMDVDDNGDLDFREFITGKALIATNLSTSESLSLAFDSFDLNQDGFVDYKELSSTLSRVFPNMEEAKIEEIFNSIDKKEGDKINKDEFIRHMKKYPEYLGIVHSVKSKSQNSVNKNNDNANKID